MAPPLLPTSPSPSSRTSLLTTRSTSSKDPLIPLYAILGIIGGVIVLIVFAFTLLLGGWCCCRQARKAYQSVAGNGRRTTYKTYNHEHWHGHSGRSSRTPSVHRSRQSVVDPRRTQYIQALPSQSYSAGPSPTEASFEHQTPRLALPYPASNHIGHLNRSENYASWAQAREIHSSPPSPLPRSESMFEHHAGHSRRPKVYTSQSHLERHRQSRSPSPPGLVRSGSRSSRQGQYEYYTSARSRPRYQSRSRRSSRERLERRASRSEQFASLISDGRPGTSDC